MHNWIDDMIAILKLAPQVHGKNHLQFIDELYKSNTTKDFAGFGDIDNAFGFEKKVLNPTGGSSTNQIFFLKCFVLFVVSSEVYVEFADKFTVLMDLNNRIRKGFNGKLLAWLTLFLI